MSPPMLGWNYLEKGWRFLGGKLKQAAKPLLAGGIGDKMDKGNLWIVPGFTLFIFAVLWTTKLSKIALEESTCRGANIYDFSQTDMEMDAQRHCQTAKRYYVDPYEAFLPDPQWRKEREVKNPEWILWFWAPIVFVMYVMTRFIWSLLLTNQGINFENVVNASSTVTVLTEDNIMEIDERKLNARVDVVAENFRCASSSRAFAAFIAFEFCLVLAPLLLLVFVLPVMVGASYRTWGFDVAKAWWDRRDWQGAPLEPMFGRQPTSIRPSVPLIPRITYCDYNIVSLGNSHIFTYRCYLDANWHERTALFTWVMLAFLTLVNFLNLFFWLEWAFRMKFKKQRRKWVIRKWLNDDEQFTPGELNLLNDFAEEFNTGNMLLVYYIEAHADRVVAAAFCAALFRRWLEKKERHWRMARNSAGGDSPSLYRTPKTKDPIGWNLDPEQGTAPSPSDYYSPPEAESPVSPATTMLAFSPPHRYSASSDSSNSKFPAEDTKINIQPTNETPRGRVQHPPRRGGNYVRNLKEHSREPLVSNSNSPLKSGGTSRERRRQDKERDRRRRGGTATEPEGRERDETAAGSRRSCAIM